MVLAPAPMSSACLLSVEKLQPKNKLNQRSEKMQKQKKIVKGDQIITMLSLSIVKDLQFLPKGYRQISEPYPVSCLTDTETSGKLTT